MRKLLDVVVLLSAVLVPHASFAQARPAALYKGIDLLAVPSTTEVRINYSEAVYDSFGAVTTGSNWSFTAPRGFSGVYHIDCSTGFDQGTFIVAGARINVRTSTGDDAQVSTPVAIGNGELGNRVVGGGTDVFLNENDSVWCVVLQSSPVTQFMRRAYTRIAIHFVTRLRRDN